MKRNVIIYWTATGVLCLIMLLSAINYFVQYDMVAEIFVALGYPTYIIYPLAVAKILGVIAILTKRSKVLKEWAYAGFFYDAVLALAAHLVAQDNQYMGAVIVLVALMVSYSLDRRLFP